MKGGLMTTFRFFLVISILSFSLSFAGEIKYFDKNGNAITKEEFHKLKTMMKKERKAFAEKVRKRVKESDLKVQKVIYTKPAKGSKPKDDMPRDSLGRPLKDSQGRWITYPDREKRHKKGLLGDKHFRFGPDPKSLKDALKARYEGYPKPLKDALKAWDEDSEKIVKELIEKHKKRLKAIEKKREKREE